MCVHARVQAHACFERVSVHVLCGVCSLSSGGCVQFRVPWRDVRVSTVTCLASTMISTLTTVTSILPPPSLTRRSLTLSRTLLPGEELVVPLAHTTTVAVMPTATASYSYVYRIGHGLTRLTASRVWQRCRRASAPSPQPAPPSPQPAPPSPRTRPPSAPASECQLENE